MFPGSSGRLSPGWGRRFTWISLNAAVAATALDAVLLEIRRGYFTGGFLAEDHLTGPGDWLTFLLLSIATDAAMLGGIVAITLACTARLRLQWRTRAVIAITVALVPVVIADVVAYRLAQYLGDAFDLALMFDLAGRNPIEFLAVSSTQLLSLAGLGLLAAAAIGAGLYGWHSRRRAATQTAFPAGRVFVAAAQLLLAGAAISTAARLGSDVFDNGLRRKPTGRVAGTVVNWLSDVDRDGAGLLGPLADPDLLNADIRPYAFEIPGNGIDDNGVGGDLPASAPPYIEALPALTPWPQRPDVILFVLESFRFDARGAMYQGRPVTPVLDALAAKGISVGQAFSPNGYTVQSRRHLFSGSVAGLERTTLIDDFNGQEYETAYFSGQDESFGGAAGDVGFERAAVAYDARADRDRRYSTFTTAGSLAVPWTVVRNRVTTFLTSRSGERPLFLYVNFEDTHFPYTHGQIEQRLPVTPLAESDIRPGAAEALRATYLNTAANVDHAIGEVLDMVRRTTGREPAIVVLADHGESLFDEGFLGHGYALNDAQTRIPLIVANLPAVVAEPFSQADLRGILLDALAHPVHDRAVPTLRQDRDRSVFQYLGTIERPRQIGLRTLQGQVLYDFRGRCAVFDRSPCRAIDSLNRDRRATVDGLIHTWERMLLARQRTGDAGE